MEENNRKTIAKQQLEPVATEEAAKDDEEGKFSPHDILEPLGFVETTLTDDNDHLLAFFQKVLYPSQEININASVTGGFENENYLLVFDFEVTVLIDMFEIHIGSYDCLVDKKMKDDIGQIFKKITTFLTQGAKLYVATQSIMDLKKSKESN